MQMSGATPQYFYRALTAVRTDSDDPQDECEGQGDRCVLVVTAGAAGSSPGQGVRFPDEPTCPGRVAGRMWPVHVGTS